MIQALPTVALMVRGGEDEAPYLPEFLDYYLSRGISHVYFVNTGRDSTYISDSLVQTDFLRFLTVISVRNTSPTWEADAFSAALEAVREEWVLNVDIDEFLFIGNQSLPSFLASRAADVACVRFPWVLRLSQRYSEPSVLQTKHAAHYASALYKSVARKQDVVACDAHRFTVRGSTETISDTAQACVCHFACRGFYDLVSRIVRRNYENAKSGKEEIEKLRGFLLDFGAPQLLWPFRFHLYRLQLCFPTVGPIRGMPQTSRYRTDIAWLRDVFYDNMRRLCIALPSGLGDELDAYVEERFSLRARLLRTLPGQQFANLHLSDGLSYVNMTHAYVSTLGGR